MDEISNTQSHVKIVLLNNAASFLLFLIITTNITAKVTN
jgi:hypothetical protein